MGEVYKIRDARPGRIAAIKTAHEKFPDGSRPAVTRTARGRIAIGIASVAGGIPQRLSAAGCWALLPPDGKAPAESRLQPGLAGPQ